MMKTQPPLRNARRGSSLARLIMLVITALCIASALAWLLTSETAERRLLEMRSTASLEQTVRESPSSPWPYYVLGVRYARMHRMAEAADLFNRAELIAPDSYDIRLANGRAETYLNAPARAIPELETASRLRADDADLYIYLAMAQREAGDKAAAVESAKRATTLAPRSAEAWFQYGILFTVEENDEGDGRPFLKKAVELDPGNGRYNYAYGSSLADGSQFGEAIPYLRKATQAYPNNSYAHFLLAVCLHRYGKGGAADVQEILSELKRSITLNPNDFRAQFELGNVLEEQGEFAAALPEFETAAHLNPNMGEIWFHLSRMAERAGKTQEAADARARFIEARRLHTEFHALALRLKEHPDDSVAQLRAGQVLEKQGNPGLAAVQYKDVLSREPQNTSARRLLEALEHRMRHTPASPGIPNSSTPDTMP